MPYNLTHDYVDKELTVSIEGDDSFARATCSASDTFQIRFPGRLITDVSVKYADGTLDEETGEWSYYEKDLPIVFAISTPDGLPFTADHVTLDDLRRFRDLRGTSQGDWSFSLSGKTDFVNRQTKDVGPGKDKGHIRIAVEETVASKSAPNLFVDTLSTIDSRRYNFDLFRVGTLEARAVSRAPVGPRTHKPLTLYDPDGTAVASGAGRLQYPVTLQTLDKSRDAGDPTSSGRLIEMIPRLWSLEAGVELGPIGRVDVIVSATVVAQTRISTRVLQDRINLLIGERGEKISIYGAMHGRDMLVRLKILDEVSAETFDMWGLLDSVIEREPFDHRAGPPDIAVNVPYILYKRSRYFGPAAAFHISNFDDIKISSINISVGASRQIQPSIPAIRIGVGVQGQATIRVGGDPLATVKIRNNHVSLEVGLRLAGDGSFVTESWIDESPVDLGVHWTTQVELALVSFGVAAAVAHEFMDGLEFKLNEELRHRFHRKVKGAMNKATPQVLAALLGDDFTYRDIRIEDQDIVFDYVAPLEPDPQPSSEGYVGIIGRPALQISGDPRQWEFTPPTLGDTYDARNLAKIDHIVVVMMENRSFDHVLGYRAQLRGLEASDGLTTQLVEFLNSLEFPDLDPNKIKFPINKLKDSDIPLNSVGKRTALPCRVGHSLTDVAEQLLLNDPPEVRHIKTSSGRWIHSPKGFIKNFNPDRAGGFAREDVLGYYEADDLPFFGFLAENYAYCEKYFCSHPGPTIPNRMFSLAGDVQYDRTGEALINNNKLGGDDFYLSRAPTIFELLTRKGIGWRVYESFPSIATLRLFARYAGDNTNIVPLGDNTDPVSRLKADVAAGTLPAVTFVDPAFHHHPENDDHPQNARERPAVDMWRGQQFLKDVYDALVSNKDLWRSTLLIITYDEHGGFYDHVIPPLAEALYAPSVIGTGRTGMGMIGATMAISYGVRVPTFVVSPWTPAGKGPDVVLDHCSILKTIIARFLGTRRHRGPRSDPRVYYTYPFLSDRVHASHSFDAYLWAAEPRLDVPASPPMADLAPEASPRPRTIITDVVSRDQMRRGNVDFQELSGRLARQLGR